MRYLRPGLLLCAFSLILSAPCGQASAGQFTEIDVPFSGATGTAALGINSQGDIVGVYQDSSFNLHNFLLREGNFSNIDPPGGNGPALLFLVSPMGINPSGDIVGNYSDSSGNHGFLLSRGTYTTIDAPGASQIFTG